MLMGAEGILLFIRYGLEYELDLFVLRNRSRFDGNLVLANGCLIRIWRFEGGTRNSHP